MNGSHSYSILQGENKICYISGATASLEKHHIYFGHKNRAVSDKYGFWVWLTSELHRGTNGVHGKNGHNLDLMLKQSCQKEFEKTNSREMFIKLVGRSYID